MQRQGFYRLVEHLIDFDVGLGDASIEAIRDYGAWFRRLLPDRVAELTSEVRQTADLAKWEADHTPDSLRALEVWFATRVETRPRSADELDAIRRRLALPIELPKETLTDRTRSLATDLGMYFGEVVLKNVPGTRWEQVTKGSRRFIDYGQPVVVGTGKVPLNPLRVITMTAWRVAGGGVADLADLYGTWSGMLATKRPESTR